MTTWAGPAGYRVSDDAAELDVPRLHEWLSSQSYWARGRPRATTDAAIAHSLNFGLYDGAGTQAGFCRWVTDGATFAWLCDVIVDPAHRGRGLGVFLVKVATEHPTVRGLRLLLGTADAHDLYRKFGFVTVPSPERLMEVRPGGTPPSP